MAFPIAYYELVYSGNHLNEWRPEAVGTYAYYIKLIDIFGKVQFRSGVVTVLK
ncbi:MAG: hypothetical protein H6607_00745 [Flavobacteriales bacterium]|nr:hypothetical protein [Flavobacteriales bacterium]